MCQYDLDNRKDDLRTCEDNLPTDAVLARMRKLVSFTKKNTKKEKGKAKIQDKSLEAAKDATPVPEPLSLSSSA